MLVERRLRILRGLAFGSALSVFGTIVMGGYTSASGAGLACPDWPLCNGALVPNLRQPEVAAEYAHRLFALSAGILILGTLLAAVSWFRSDRRILFLSLASFVLLVAQVTLGMLAITSRLNPVVVTSHLAIGTATFAFTLLLAAVIRLTAPRGVRGGPSLG